MYDLPAPPHRGTLRLTPPDTPSVPVTHEPPLTEPERDALEHWVPKGAHLLAHTRGRPLLEGRPVWAITTTGILIAQLTDEDEHRVRARVRWVAAEDLRRIDLITEPGVVIVRVVTAARRFVLHALDEASATRFVALVRAAAASVPPRRARRLVEMAP